MKILHVGLGYWPLRGGGLIEYAEDLMQAQRTAGAVVGYFCAGRHYPLPRKPILRRWRRRGVFLFEVINSPIHPNQDTGTRTPLMDLAEPRTESCFATTLAEFQPDIIHIQELAGLPSSLIELAVTNRIPIVMTLQDYTPLCPTVKLFDVAELICIRDYVGDICVQCCANAPADFRKLMQSTADYHTMVLQPRLPRPVHYVLHKGKNFVTRPFRRPAPEPRTLPERPAEEYQRRRETNVARLNKIDLLIAQSTRLAEIYRRLGIEAARIRPLQFTLRHLETLQPKTISEPPRPVRIITLNGCSSIPKGSRLVLGALEILRAAGAGDSFELLVCGQLGPPNLEPALLRHPNIRYRGMYDPRELDRILEEGDVGLVPSVWEEAYGYTGVEMLAKGLPVIGNAIGGITDYVREGETGWLNVDNTAEGLAAIIRRIVDQPEQIVELNAKIRAAHHTIIRPMASHAAELDALYRGVVSSAAAL